MLYLRIGRRFLCLFPPSTTAHPNPAPLPPPPGASGNLYVIAASLDDLRPFAGNTVDWLIVVARHIFEPLGSSSLYTFTTHTLEWWIDRDSDLQWRQVLPGEELQATIYEFRPDHNAFVTLTKISLRHARSITTNHSTPQATPLHTSLLERDVTCVISQQPRQRSLIASHLIPRRLGDSGVQSAFLRFTGSPIPVTRYDPRIVVLLYRGLDEHTNVYEMGFWNVGPNQYRIHDFVHPPVNIYGAQPMSTNERMCHGTAITLSPHGTPHNLPPAGVFQWHYIQCVLKRFSTAAYHNFANVYYFVQPFRAADDDDDESDRSFDDPRNIADPPYPTYLLELAEARARQRLDEEERRQAVAAWNSGVVGN